jgi:hypothetical protein
LFFMKKQQPSPPVSSAAAADTKVAARALPRSSDGVFPARGKAFPLPHERDESAGEEGGPPSDVIRQAGQDLGRGLVDTDMRATPGLDGPRREKLVPGAAGRSARRPDKPGS